MHDSITFTGRVSRQGDSRFIRIPDALLTMLKKLNLENTDLEINISEKAEVPNDG